MSADDRRRSAETLAERLRRVAERVARLAPQNHDPERFFVDRDEARRELAEIADALAPPRGEARKPPDSQFHCGRIIARGRAIEATTRGRPRPSAAEASAKKAFR